MARTYQLKREPAAKPGTGDIDFASLLNPQQLEAVTSKAGPALVIAGAGSGKTRTLTYRVAYLLEQGIDPNNVLLLTFTNKAAQEMTSRVRQLVPADVFAIWSGTFHAIGSRILRKHADRIGLTRAFSIMDRDDQNSMLTLAKKSANFSKEITSEKRFPRPGVLADIYSFAQNVDQPLQDILERRYEHLEEFWEAILEIQKVYEKKKLESNAVDFDDLLTKTLKLLRENDDLREGYQEKFRAILVDEYQDTNPVQSRLVDLLANKYRHLMVVGDDAQSIYSWRGADFRNIMEFPKRYPGTTIYKIETNYRSVPEVLKLANKSISANVHQFEKVLQPARPPCGSKPALVPLADPNVQAIFVAQRLQELHDEDGLEYAKMAVLYRAHFQSMELQMELTNRKIPFRITSGLRFFEQAHIKDITSFLRFIVNPRDEVAFKRMLKLVRGIGEVTAEKLWSAWLGCAASNDFQTPPKYSDLLSGFKVPSRAEEMWRQLMYVLDELVDGGDWLRPADMITSIMEGMYLDFMKTEFTNFDRRRQDIDQFKQYSEQFDDLLDLLEKLSLLGNADNGGQADRRDEEDADQVNLSTVHQAKGLEWKAVFIIGLNEGMFPNRRVLEAEEGAVEAFEEERRLFYVALTRACDQLYLTFPLTRPMGSHTGDYYQLPSSFLQELPEELMEEWDVGGIW